MNRPQVPPGTRDARTGAYIRNPVPVCAGAGPEQPSRLLKGIGIALLISLPIDAAIVWAVLKLAGVL
jgi:hypothetical protein